MDNVIYELDQFFPEHCSHFVEICTLTQKALLILVRVFAKSFLYSPHCEPELFELM